MPVFAPSLLAVLCWGAMFPIAASALDHVDAVHVTAVRYSLATVAFVAILAAVEGRGALRFDGRFRRSFLLGTCGFAGFNLLVYAGLRHTEPQTASLMVATSPLLTVIGRWLTSGERPSAATLACLGVAFAGVALVISGGDPAALLSGGVGLGELLVLLGVVAWVRYTLGAADLDGWSPLRFTALSAVGGTISILAIAAVADAAGWLAPPSAADLGAIGPELAYITLAGAVVAVLAWNAGIQRLGVADGALFFNVVPVTTFTIEIARGYEPGTGELAGATLTIGALVAANLFSRGVRAREAAAGQARRPAVALAPGRAPGS